MIHLFKKLSLLFLVAIGIIANIIALFILKIPPSLRRIHVLEGYIIKIIIAAVGLALIFIPLYFLISKHNQRKQKLERIAVNFILLAVTVFISLSILELVLQLTSIKGCRQNDPLIDHSYRPNCRSSFKSEEWTVPVSINSHGMRDDEIALRENFNHRILLLGDSFLMGYGVRAEDSFAYLLEQKLKDAGLKTDVLNGGVTSYSPILEYLYLRERSLELQPDIVVLLFDMSDVQNDYLYEKQAVFDSFGELVAVPYAEPKSILLKLYNKLKVIKFLERFFSILDARSAGTAEINQANYYDLDHDKYAITREGLPPEKEQEYWNYSLGYIQKMAEFSQERNITFVLATYPYGHQVSAEEWVLGRHNYGFEQGIVYSDRPNSILEEFAKDENMPFISLFADFKQSEVRPLYFPYDGHFNNDGHKLAAEVLYREINKLKVLRDEIVNPEPAGPVGKRLQSENNLSRDRFVNNLFDSNPYRKFIG